MTYAQYTAMRTVIEADQSLANGTLWKYTKSISVRDITNTDIRDLYKRNRVYFIDNGGAANLFTGFVILDDLNGDKLESGFTKKDIVMIPLDQITSITFDLPNPYATADEVAALFTTNTEGDA